MLTLEKLGEELFTITERFDEKKTDQEWYERKPKIKKYSPYKIRFAWRNGKPLVFKGSILMNNMEITSFMRSKGYH